MNFKPLAIAALLATSLVAPSQVQARQYHCFANSIAGTMEEYLAGGTSLGEAWVWAVEETHSTDNQRCWSKTVGVANRYPLALPFLRRAIKNR